MAYHGIQRPLGYQQLTVDSVTALTVPAGTMFAIAVCETQACRWRDDGPNPTATVGFPQATGSIFDIPCPATFKAISQTPGSILNIAYYAGGAV